MSFSNTYSNTFSITNAKHLASSVATDLKRIQRFYGQPSDLQIDNFQEELTALLKEGYMEKITYGFKRDGEFIEPTVSYKAEDIVSSGINDDPGKIKPGKNIEGASFYSYLCRSQKWWDLTLDQKQSFNQSIPDMISIDDPV